MKSPLLVLAVGLAAALFWLVPQGFQDAPYDPLESGRQPARAKADFNFEGTVPSMCYTKTAGVSNACWTCHNRGTPPNLKDDRNLQEEYSFSSFALINHWTNLFQDRRAAIAATSDLEILEWIRADNYAPLRKALEADPSYAGYRPDLDLDQGFDDQGFAQDGSGWRALRYAPFPGTFWPTNGSTDDVYIRLPYKFRSPSKEIYLRNLDLLEAVLCIPPERPAHLPDRYLGDASDVPVRRFVYPEGTEFLHTVRYLDPDQPTMLSRRMKEVRYSRKFQSPDEWALTRHYEKELSEKDEGKLPGFAGTPLLGFRNRLGWLYQGFIEDSIGRLRVQTREEHLTCMGCHTALGVTVDGSFAFPRKLPGDDGWRPQDLRSIRLRPQAGHAESEVLTYFRRVKGGDEFRANDELLRRWFKDGEPDAAALLAAKDLAAVLIPSRERALGLDKAYRLIVREQSFILGRDAFLSPALNVHAKIENGQTDLGKTGKVYSDGRLWMDWGY